MHGSRGSLPKWRFSLRGYAIFEEFACLHYGHPLPQSEKLGNGQNTDPQSMDSPNGLPLKWTTPKNNILNEYN